MSSGVELDDHTCRYHIGESLIPSVRHYLRFIDAEQKLVDMGFKHKVWQEASSTDRARMILINTKQPGAAIKFNQFKREGCRPQHQYTKEILTRVYRYGLRCAWA